MLFIIHFDEIWIDGRSRGAWIVVRLILWTYSDSHARPDLCQRMVDGFCHVNPHGKSNVLLAEFNFAEKRHFACVQIVRLQFQNLLVYRLNKIDTLRL